MPIAADLQSLTPDAIIEMYELDSSSVGGAVDRFYAGTNELLNPLVWQGKTYSPLPIEVSGFEVSGSGSLARPKVKVANVEGLIGALTRQTNDLIGAKFTRIRTFKKYLDAVNFLAGNSLADSTQEFPRDVFYVDRKSVENKVFVEFELAAPWDVQGIQLPRRQVLQNVCTWKYRGGECGYAGGAVADISDNPTSNLALDVCGKRLLSCELRFGVNQPLPFGGFPGTGMSR